MDGVPSPADGPHLDAHELLAQLREQGARVYRMREAGVFVLTDRAETADWLLDLGGKPYKNAPYNDPAGSFMRARDGKREWDIWAHTIPLKGDQTLWELVS